MPREDQSSELIDRARGAVLGSATGDALGAAYEFESAPLGPNGPEMLGGGLGNFAPGEWTDDTTMAWCILAVAADHSDLRTDEALTEIGVRFRQWYDTHPADIGNQTRTILRRVGTEPTGTTLAQAAFDLHSATGHTAGNGSLMRTAPVALRYLDDPVDDPDALVEAARRISSLTHHDHQAQDACALWSLAIRHAILTGNLDLSAGLVHLEPDAAAKWTGLIEEAEQRDPDYFNPNGWVVTALQAAWSAIVHTPTPPDRPARHFSDALDAAIRIGNDTDTVAAIAGALLGAHWGVAAIPEDWLTILHGYPGITANDLQSLVDRALHPNPPTNRSPGRH